ncbi:hypothetical protein OG730_00115 [Streptomyces sp. NBC_01298]|uniref:hypothetical protein n=1 Tax=Streptomyces sp. NBC_01298 TaxID=2903817 RepID=UPI002E100742|nr:hypothetical protein OG730_00115 [Streptomyces sp. NBC_01298]
MNRTAARRAVAARAVGTADLDVLLDMLGLRPEGDPPEKACTDLTGWAPGD